MGFIFTKKEMKLRRRQLRNSMTKAEISLWMRLKKKQVLGYKFRRQHSIGYYVVDFYCPELKLAIEVDGPSHFEAKTKKYDKRRRRYIESFGVIFYRITNDDVYHNIDGVIEKLILTIKKLSKNN
ncbi:MAG: endonuclease domain-containing protein [Patescibacteria group bacterium]|nr:endonuclease domain-containing protein [Patescibacteria group bacterium]